MKPEDVNFIVVHATGHKSGRPVNERDVFRQWRLRGFSGIGVHFLITRAGSVICTRSLETAGFHVTGGRNSESVGVAYVGGRNQAGDPADTRTADQRDALEKVLAALRKVFPGGEIVGADHFAPTSVDPYTWVPGSPCFNAQAEYADL